MPTLNNLSKRPKRPSFRRGVFLLFAFIATSSAWSDPTARSSQDVWNQVKKSQTQLKRLRLEFSQTLFAQGFAPQKASGRLLFERPFRLLLQQDRPEKQIIQSDGTSVSLYSPAQKQQMKGAWDGWLQQSALARTLVDFIRDPELRAWDQRYDVLFGGIEQNCYHLILKPKKSGDGFSELHVWIADGTFFPKKIQTKTSEQTMTIDLKNIQINSTISPSAWKVSVPADVVIIPGLF